MWLKSIQTDSSLPVILPLWVQGAVCTWTEWTPFPRRSNSHLQSACWGRLLSCTRRWPEERRHLVRSALKRKQNCSELGETPGLWSLPCSITVHNNFLFILQAAAQILSLQAIMGELLVVRNYQPLSSLTATLEVIEKVITEQLIWILFYIWCNLITERKILLNQLVATPWRKIKLAEIF